MNFKKLDKAVDDLILCGVPMCDVAVSYKGETVYRHSAGFADAAKTRPVSDRDIYWLFSCSKVITCLAAMRLVEEGKLSLSDPVSKYIPEYADLCVKNGKTGEITKATVPMTVEHLFTMTGGMNYNTSSAPVESAFSQPDATTVSVVKAMAKVPLDFEPGTHYKYSLCHDVLAAVVEIAGGMRFSDYLQKYFFDPLGMVDIGFRPNDEQKSRFSDMFRYCAGTQKALQVPLENKYTLCPNYDSGGAGLFSTVDEYMKLITAIANGGKTKDGYTLLKPETIKMCCVNRLNDASLNDFVTGRLFGYGWGLCGRVHRSQIMSLSNSPVGEFGWDGAAGAFSMIDPINNVALYLGTHLFGFNYGYNVIHPLVRNLAYEALEI